MTQEHIDKEVIKAQLYSMYVNSDTESLFKAAVMLLDAWIDNHEKSMQAIKQFILSQGEVK